MKYHIFIFSAIMVSAPLHYTKSPVPHQIPRHTQFPAFLLGIPIFLCQSPSPSAGSWGAVSACCEIGMQSLSPQQTWSQQTAFHPGDLDKFIQWAAIKMNCGNSALNQDTWTISADSIGTFSIKMTEISKFALLYTTQKIKRLCLKTKVSLATLCPS